MCESRLISLILAIGGAFWGVFCAFFFLCGDPFAALMYLGPGYVVTAAYWWRLFSTPPVESRRFIWGLSALVQGAWCVWGVIALIHDGWRNVCFDLLTNGWWVFALVASVYCLFTDIQSASVETKNNGDSDPPQIQDTSE